MKEKEKKLLKWIILGTFSLSLSVYAGAPGTYHQAKTALEKVSQKNLLDLLTQFVAAGSPSRMVGMPGHEKAKLFLMETIQKMDSKKTGKMVLQSTPPDMNENKRFYQADFDEKIEGKFPKTHPDYQKWSRFTTHMQEVAERLKASPVENIVWEKTGLNASKVLVITAHYDTISHDPNNLTVMEKAAMPGANYNASGVSVALGLIKTLSQFDLNYSVQVVFLDWQGIGFLGSYQYAKELKELSKTTTVLGVVNLEMLGQDTSFFDKTKKTGNMSVYLRQNNEEAKFVQTLLQHGSKVDSKVSFEFKPIGFENSDNFRFWEQGLLSATFSQNWEDDFNPKFYQNPQDTPETLNHTTLYHAYQYLGGAVLGTLLDLSK